MKENIHNSHGSTKGEPRVAAQVVNLNRSLKKNNSFKENASPEPMNKTKVKAKAKALAHPPSRNFTLIDFPADGQTMGDFKGTSPKQAAKKAFTQLARKTGLEDKNQKIIVFSIRERGTEKVHTYMGQRIRMARPVRVKIGDRLVTYHYQNVVTKYRGA